MKKYLFFILCFFVLGYVQAQEIKSRSKEDNINILKDILKPPYLSIVENSLKFIDADGNNMIDADESCKIKFQLSNSGTGDGLDMKATVKETSGITVIQFDKTTSLGTLKTGQTLNVEIPIKGLKSIYKGKTSFSITIEELNGFNTAPATIEVKTREFQAPMVKINDYTITSDGSTTIQKNKPFNIQMLVQNKGYGNAGNVKLKITYPENIFLINGNITENIGSLISGSSKAISYSLVVPMAYTGSAIPLKFSLTEKYGKYGMDTTITIVINQSVSSNKRIIEGINLSDNEMIFVQGDTFSMGSNYGESDEKPVHRVTLSSYYIGKYEVTQKLWYDIMRTNPSSFGGCDNCPVEKVSWNDVQKFITKLNATTGKVYRLPTEAEWEFAARGGNKSKGYIYSGSNSLGEVAWFTNNSSNKTHAVGQKAVNELGIFDMSGNVWEWCSDWYGSDYYSNSPQNNPKGPSTGVLHVFRGGSWDYFASYCRSSFRTISTPIDRINSLGFRLVLEP